MISIQCPVIRNFCLLLSLSFCTTVKAEPIYKKPKNSEYRILSTDNFFSRHAEGWHWYSLRESNVRESPLRGSIVKKTEQNLPSPTEVIESQRKGLEQKLHTAIVTPTQENIVSYILAQRALMDQSQRFSETWQRVVMNTPSLDETLQHPVDQKARHVYYDEHHKTLQRKIKSLAQDYGLFFFFKKDCAYCHHFAPIVKHFAETYGWFVLPVSLDGGRLKEFPKAKRNNGIAERLQVSQVPALIALHVWTCRECQEVFFEFIHKSICHVSGLLKAYF